MHLLSEAIIMWLGCAEDFDQNFISFCSSLCNGFSQKQLCGVRAGFHRSVTFGLWAGGWTSRFRAKHSELTGKMGLESFYQ